jgi:hypothetical protein
MPNVKFESEFTHQIDDNTRKTWPAEWFGEVSADVAKAARKAGSAIYFGEGAADAEAAFQADLETEAAEVAAAATADKKGSKAKEPAKAGDDAGKLV